MTKGGYMLINIWNKITVYCLNHKEPVPMVIMSNTKLIKTPFYTCSTTIEGEGVDAKFDGNAGLNCANRMNLDDYQNMVLKFINMIEKEPPTTNFENFSFYYKGARQKLYVQVLKFNDKEIRLGVKNITILGK